MGGGSGGGGGWGIISLGNVSVRGWWSNLAPWRVLPRRLWVVDGMRCNSWYGTTRISTEGRRTPAVSNTRDEGARM
jgi:hypothetical protein